MASLACGPTPRPLRPASPRQGGGVDVEMTHGPVEHVRLDPAEHG